MPRWAPKLFTLGAWLWLFLPLVWMWPTARSLSEALLSALLLMGLLLARATSRVAVIALWLIGMAFLSYFFAVHSLPDEFFWQAVLGSTPSEASEYLQSFRPTDTARILTWAVPALVASIYLWRQKQPLHSKKVRVVAWFTVAIWLLWISISLFKGYDVYRIFSRVDRIYPLMLVHSWERYEHNKQFALLPSPSSAPTHAPMIDVLVVVLGESASAHRWSLLGYQGGPTNAALAPWQQGLISMPLTTNGNNTGQTLPVIVTGQSLNPLPITGVASYIDQAKAAGFRNEVYANQQAPEGLASVALRMRSDSFTRLQDGHYDGALTPLFTAALHNAQTSAQPLLITLHTYGSHPSVDKRTPPEKAAGSEPYDNSIHYTSQLIAQWIAQLNTLKDKRTALLYVSDHGQDFPVCGGSYVHGITRSTYEVPFLLWTNSTVRQLYRDWWQQWIGLAQHAVTDDGVPRYTTLLPAQAIEQLLGYDTQPPTPTGSPAGMYPPVADSSLCTDWFPQVQKLHPAARP